MKINVQEYKNIWFTSDWHLGHNKEFLYGPRGCLCRDDHVELLLRGINKQAGKNDLIIHLGDMSLTSTYEEYCEWMSRIKCNNIFSLYGNHDGNFRRLMKRHHEACTFNNPPILTSMEKYLLDKDIRPLGDVRELTIIEPSEIPNRKAHKRSVTICHYPMILWNKSHHGSFSLCGHSHGSLIPSQPLYPIGKRLDCGVENALMWSQGKNVLFSWEDVKNIMRRKEIDTVDHHNEETT